MKFRSTMQPVPATAVFDDDGAATLIPATPQYGVSPGQAAVCYDGDRMIGGGWITETDNKALRFAA